MIKEGFFSPNLTFGLLLFGCPNSMFFPECICSKRQKNGFHVNAFYHFLALHVRHQSNGDESVLERELMFDFLVWYIKKRDTHRNAGRGLGSLTLSHHKLSMNKINDYQKEIVSHPIKISVSEMCWAAATTHTQDWLIKAPRKISFSSNILHPNSIAMISTLVDPQANTSSEKTQSIKKLWNSF